MKYTNILYLSDHPELQRVYKEFTQIAQWHGKGSWGALFKGEKHKAAVRQMNDVNREFNKLLAETIGYDVNYTFRRSNEPRQLGEEHPMMILYKRKEDE